MYYYPLFDSLSSFLKYFQSYNDRRHGGHRSPREELYRSRFQLNNNGDGEVGNSGNANDDNGAVRGTGSNDSGVGSIGTSQNNE